MLIGLLIMIVSEAATLAGIEPFASWNTPVAWTGFIIFADSLVWKRRGNSWLHSAPREFAFLAAVSLPLWLVFEFYNLFIRNWYYTGLPDNFALRMFGYVWSFATIWPAIFEGAELVAVIRPAGPRPTRAIQPTRPTRPFRPFAWIVAGAICLCLPFLVTARVASYLAAPVWLGFIFLLDPVNARLGETSLIAELSAGYTDRLVNLAASGVLCGFLWEFWNYWSHAKWHYAVPFLAQVSLFEMPLPGYLGFPAFALECFTMYVFVRAMLGIRGREVAL